MRSAIHRIQFACDLCGRRVVEDRHGADDRSHTLPDGWFVKETHDHGMTSYSRRNDVCPACLGPCPSCHGSGTRWSDILKNPVWCERCEGDGVTIAARLVDTKKDS